MRSLSYIIIGVAILLLAGAGYDEYRGATHEPSMGSLSGSGLYFSGVITRASKPKDFRNAMTVHWAFALLLLFAGIAHFLINRGVDAADPMSPDSDKNLDEELRADEESEQPGK